MTCFMLDTCICSFIMRERPCAVLQRFVQETSRNNRLVISAITYAEMRYGQIGKKASPKHKILVDWVFRLIVTGDSGIVTAQSGDRDRRFRRS